MSLPVLALLVAATFLIADWALKTRAIRLVAVTVAVGGILLLEPNLYEAFRSALTVPPEDRVRLLGQRELSEYESGVETMRREVVAHVELHRPSRTILEVTLIWLALSPALLRARRTPRREGETASRGSTTDSAS